MEISDLEAIGLSPHQAEVYDYLIKNGQQKPSVVAQKLRFTRTNAYKILDSLVELKLIKKVKAGKIFSYQPVNPIALASLTAQYRAEAVAREEKVNNIMHDLLKAYGQHTDKPGVEVFSGRDEVASAYRKQINLKEDIRFIHTRADVPNMGFELMHEIRVAPARHGNKRKAIISSSINGKVNDESHKRSNLDITWIKNTEYDAPVEWSITDSSLLIVSYSATPQAILIIDPVITAAFGQIFTLLESNFKNKKYKTES